MKKLLQSIILIAVCTTAVQAQRLVLYEEFTGENSEESAAANPTLNATIAANPGKIVLLRYQTPLPSAGPIYNQNTADVNARQGYYGVTFVPYGRVDGKVLGIGGPAPGDVAHLTQSAVDQAYNVSTPFSISVSHTWSADGDSIFATINVTANSAVNMPAANIRLRTALVEHLQFNSSPGTSDETDFPNVMRSMYPDANGQAIPGVWTASQTQSYTIAGPVATYVDKVAETFLIAWIQNDVDKVVAQTGMSAVSLLPLDVGSDNTSFTNPLVCATGTVTGVVGNVTLRNAGTTALTSAIIYYKYDNGTLQNYSWTGNIAPGGTANVVLPSANLNVGVHTLYDSVGMPNGVADANLGNSSSTALVTVFNNTPVNLPMNTGFEGTSLPGNWRFYNPNGDEQNWELVANVGHSGTHAIKYNNFTFTPGEVNYCLLPKPNILPGNKALDFWVAYAQYANEEDELAVVYTMDCGLNWINIWSVTGEDLATRAPVGNNTPFEPTATEWAYRSIDMTNLPNGAIVAFRATSDYGNNLYIDDVALRTGNWNSVPEVLKGGPIAVYPNPARNETTIAFNVIENSSVNVLLLDAMGRIVRQIANGRMEQGYHKLTLPTADLAAGVYTVRLLTDEGSFAQPLSVVK